MILSAEELKTQFVEWQINPGDSREPGVVQKTLQVLTGIVELGQGGDHKADILGDKIHCVLMDDSLAAENCHGLRFYTVAADKRCEGLPIKRQVESQTNIRTEVAGNMR